MERAGVEGGKEYGWLEDCEREWKQEADLPASTRQKMLYLPA